MYYAALAVGISVLFFPTVVDTAMVTSVSADMVVKAAGNSPDVYYVASNGKRYRFPDQSTFITWYNSFSVVKEVSPTTFNNIPDGGGVITSRPGAKLVTFPGNNRVYAVSSGAVIRWVTKESVAQKIYGAKWQQHIVTIPVSQVNQYIVGLPIKNADEYNAFLELEKNISPNAELAHRGYITKETEPKKQNNLSAEPVALLAELGEDLSAKLSPKFNAYTYSYTLDAGTNEQYVSFKPKAANDFVSVFVNGVPTAPGSVVRFEITEGVQVVTISAVGPTGKSTNYYVNISRPKKSEGSAKLIALSENLSNNLSPAFSPNVREYSFPVEYTEEILRLTPKAESGAEIKINGIPVESGKPRELHIPRGESVIKISVRNGDKYLLYTINVNREKGLSEDMAKLKELNTDLKTLGDKPFQPFERDYHLNVEAGRKSITVFAKPANKETRVFINDVETEKSTETIYSGTTRITIKTVSPEGAEMTYRIFVNRPN